MKRVILILVLLTAVGAVAFFLARPPSPAKVETSSVRKGAITSVVSASGEIASKSPTVVSAQSPGVVLELTVPNGGWATRGATLMVVGTRASQEDYIEQLDDLQEARRELADVKAEPASQRGRNELSNAEDDVEEAKDDLEDERDDSRNTELISPSRGWVTYEEIGAGGKAKTISAGTYVSPGQVVATVVDPRKLVLSAAIDEADVVLVQKGLAADIMLDSYPDLSFKGKVEKVFTAPSTSSSGGTAFQSIIAFTDKRPRALRAGMSGSVDILTKTVASTTVVPFEAIQGSTDSPYVYVVESMPEGRKRVVKRAVETGVSSESEIEVLSGVEIGDKVVVSDAKALKDGATVVTGG